jgi:hypothetical protein
MSERRRRNESEREVLVVWRTLAVVSLPAIKKFRIVSRSSPSVAEAPSGEISEAVRSRRSDLC